nr:hypothetical protein Ahy_A10g050690 [Ipomoea batatas]GMD22595.1 hypothetical protein Ahy_A10g050690 [Ipomoea batatas]
MEKQMVMRILSLSYQNLPPRRGDVKIRIFKSLLNSFASDSRKKKEGCGGLKQVSEEGVGLNPGPTGYHSAAHSDP